MSLPIVALIGRPNVGKSTLFNRIVGGRESIVHDMPGVTRDRKYMETEWAGRSFILMDTGGYMPDSSDLIERAIYEQVLGAIEEADLIVFLVDARSGLTALDQEIGRLLKKGGSKVLLAVNKADNERLELDLNEFYELGLEKQVPISAASGRRVGDFLDEVIACFPDPQNVEWEEADHKIKLAVIGRPNVGKSSFVNALLGRKQQIVTEVPGTTRDSSDTVLKYFDEEFLLIDTAGLRKKAKVKEAIEFYSTLRSLQSIKRCHVAILLIDATQGLESQDIRILHEAIQLNKGVLLAVNKWDLVEKDANTAKRFEDEIKDALKNIRYLPVMFISALTKQRIFKVLDVAKSVYLERQRTLKTAELNKFLEKIIEKNPPPSMDRREVKLKYCTQVKSGPPVIAFFSNAPKSIPANYRSYIENQFRAQFGFYGVPLTFIFKKK